MRVTLYTKPGCSLCDEAAATLDELGVDYETATDQRFEQRVPVIEVDGEIVAELRVDARTLKRELRRRSRHADRTERRG